MKKHLILIVGAVCFIITITAFLLYVLPYSKKVNLFEAEYLQHKNECMSIARTIRSTNDINEFTNSLEHLLLFPTKVKELAQRLIFLNQRSNFITNFWKKNRIDANNINEIDKEINLVYTEIPGLTSKLINYDADFRIDKMRGINDLPTLNSYFVETKNSYDSLFYQLATVSRSEGFTNVISFNVLQNNKSSIVGIADECIESLSGLREEQYNDFKNSLLNAKTIKDASSLTNTYISWLKTCKSTSGVSASMGANENNYENLIILINKDLSEMHYWSSLYSEIISSERRANEILISALEIIDESNNKLNNMEKFASSNDIRVVYNYWRDAEREVQRSAQSLECKGGSQEKQIVWNNLVERPMSNINIIHQEVQSHKDFVGTQLDQAITEESTIQGNVTRTAQRGFDRAKRWITGKAEEVSSSRIARELSIGVKFLILGTKAFYDLQDPSTDPLTWAFSYEDEVNGLMEESEEVMSMEGPSLTGKNTFIEDFADVAYENSFH